MKWQPTKMYFYRPLLYGMEIQEEFKVLRSYEFDSKDYEVSTSLCTTHSLCPTPKVSASSPWNYAICIKDDSDLDDDMKFQKIGFQKNTPPFSIKGTPVKISATVQTHDTLYNLSLFSFSPLSLLPSLPLLWYRDVYLIHGGCLIMLLMLHPLPLSPLLARTYQLLYYPLVLLIWGLLKYQLTNRTERNLFLRHIPSCLIELFKNPLTKRW